ncbi:hypothetical protein EXIGLDRAFT_736563 [Exidia glandulosa HHB12029]|uniref:Uncharacterized protein n=1 Tax=Exidia glandulosa HHB12029 TaxID=1314781 RepID=A0A166N651_EXIGL|nr:hypothetical protein EXIGLDRAFT_736563 [Exidia glandulosa HHB12029]
MDTMAALVSLAAHVNSLTLFGEGFRNLPTYASEGPRVLCVCISYYCTKHPHGLSLSGTVRELLTSSGTPTPDMRVWPATARSDFPSEPAFLHGASWRIRDARSRHLLSSPALDTMLLLPSSRSSRASTRGTIQTICTTAQQLSRSRHPSYGCASRVQRSTEGYVGGLPSYLKWRPSSSPVDFDFSQRSVVH